MRPVALMFACAIFATASAGAFASPITYTLTNGTFVSGGTIGGTITIDGATGAVTGTLTASEYGQNLTFVDSSNVLDLFGNSDIVFVDNATSDTIYLELPGTIGASFDGGSLCTTATACSGGTSGDIIGSGTHDGSTDYLKAGSLVAATPEPSSLLLMGTGILGAVGVAKRRYLAA